MKNPRQAIRDSMLDDETVETRDLDFAAYLYTMGLPVISQKTAVAPTGAYRCYWTFKHPSAKKIAHQYIEGIHVVPYRLMQNRMFLKRRMSFPDKPHGRTS